MYDQCNNNINTLKKRFHHEKKILMLIACEQALCLGKNSEEREGKGGREPVDKHLRPLFRLL